MMNSAEQERIENEAEIFSILMTNEVLEKLYIRDSIGPDEYKHFDVILILFS